METKAKILLIGLLVILILLGIKISQASATFMWTELGRAPLMPGVYNPIALAEKFPFSKWEIREGLRQAVPVWDAEDATQALKSAIMAGWVKEASLPPGARFEWMICKPRPGVATVLRNVEWAGGFPLEGFVVSTHRYGTFFIAKKCGNLTKPLAGPGILPTRPPGPSLPPREIIQEREDQAYKDAEEARRRAEEAREQAEEAKREAAEAQKQAAIAQARAARTQMITDIISTGIGAISTLSDLGPSVVVVDSHRHNDWDIYRYRHYQLRPCYTPQPRHYYPRPCPRPSKPRVCDRPGGSVRR